MVTLDQGFGRSRLARCAEYRGNHRHSAAQHCCVQRFLLFPGHPDLNA